MNCVGSRWLWASGVRDDSLTADDRLRASAWDSGFRLWAFGLRVCAGCGRGSQWLPAADFRLQAVLEAWRRGSRATISPTRSDVLEAR
jgi:hypothetical protein